MFAPALSSLKSLRQPNYKCRLWELRRSLSSASFFVRRVPWLKAKSRSKQLCRSTLHRSTKPYRLEIDVGVTAATSNHRQTFRSAMDLSTQYYGVVPPSEEATQSGHGVVLSLHGASVEAMNQANSYRSKSWGYIVAPTNRRPFGFDWQSWGRLDALESLADAKLRYGIDPTRVYLTGHSMGGHGTWHLGVHHPGLFAVLGPSAGWSSPT